MLILTADMLSAEWIYQDGVTLSLEDVAAYLKSDRDIDSSARAHEHVMQWIVRNQNHIMPVKKGTTPFTSVPYGRNVKMVAMDTTASLYWDASRGSQRFHVESDQF